MSDPDLRFENLVPIQLTLQRVSSLLRREVMTHGGGIASDILYLVDGGLSRGLSIYDAPGIAERIDGCLDAALPPLRTAEMLLCELGPHYDSTGLAIAYKSLGEALDLIEQNRLEGATLIS
jgi:hypothetical protein